MRGNTPNYLPLAANLQPWRELRRKRALKRISLGLVLCMLLAVGAYIWQAQRLAPERKHLTAQHQALQSKLAQSKARQHKLSRSPIEFSSLINAQRLHLTMALLQRELPGEAKLTSLELGKEMVIAGATYHKEVLAGLINQLKAHRLVSDASLRQVSERADEWGFTLVLKLDAERMAVRLFETDETNS